TVTWSGAKLTKSPAQARSASCWMVSAAPRRSMVSVEISLRSSTLLAWPVASTWSGITVDWTTVYPSAGRPAKSGCTGLRRRASRSTCSLRRAGSRRRILMRRGRSGRSMSALSSMRVSPTVAAARSIERRTFRSSTPSRMVRGPRSVTLIGFVGGVVTMSPGWSFRMVTGSSTTRSASRSLTLMENQRKKASRSEMSFMPGLWRSPSRRSRRLGTRRSRRQGGVGPGGAGGAGSGADTPPGRGRRAKSLMPRPSPGAASPPPPSFHQQPLQRGAQRGGVHVARDLPLAHQRDHPVLLGDNDGERVGLLGEADGRPVARAEGFRDGRVGGEREEAAGGGDAAVLDDERSVVDRRDRHEDAGEELLRDPGVERWSHRDVLVQPDLALQHDQRAHPPRGEVGDALHQLLDRLALRDAVLGREERLHAHLRQGAADVVLEDDEDEHQ